MSSGKDHRGRGRATVRTTDLRLLPAALASWLVAFIAVQLDLRQLLLLAVLPLGGGIAAAITVLRGRDGGRGRHRAPAGWSVPGTMLLVCVAATAMCLAVGAHLHLRSSGLLAPLTEEGAVVSVIGRVASEAEVLRPRHEGEQPRHRVLLRAEQVAGRSATSSAHATLVVLGDEAWQHADLGQRITSSGRLVPTEAGERASALLIAHDGPESHTKAPAHLRLVHDMRQGLITSLHDAAPQAQGLVPGVAIGDDSRAPPQLQEAMRTVSLTHVTAVSGTHLAIVLGLVMGLLHWAPSSVRAVFGALIIVGFVVLVRPEPSVLRSATMGGIGLLALLLRRSSAALPALCLAVIALLLADPWHARAYGFALSVLATGGLVLLAHPWAGKLARFLPTPLAHAVAVPAAAQTCCAPVIILLTPELATYAVPANVLALPALVPATALALIAALLAPWAPGATDWLTTAASWPTGWIAHVATTFADLPGAALPWPEGVMGAVLLAGCTIVAFLVLPRIRAPAAVAIVMMGLLLLHPLPRHVGARLIGQGVTDWVAAQCDVGQGSASLLRAGPQSAVMIDTGPPEGDVSRCLRDLDVERLELLVLTHLHLDHVGGLAETLEHTRVQRALLSPHDAPLSTEAQVLELLGAHDVPVERPVVGKAQPQRGAQVAWRQLWPTAAAIEGVASGDETAANDMSLVLELWNDEVSMLALGDVEHAGQRGLLRGLAASETAGEAGRLNVDVVVVAHHGSRFQEAELAEQIEARLALIGVGQDNDYGHPAQATRDMYGRGGRPVLGTDECGTVVVIARNEQLLTSSACTTGQETEAASVKLITGGHRLDHHRRTGPRPPGRFRAAPVRWQHARLAGHRRNRWDGPARLRRRGGSLAPRRARAPPGSAAPRPRTLR